MWEPGDHPHPHFAITGCLGEGILRTFGQRPASPIDERIQGLKRLVRHHLSDPLLPEPSDPDLDWIAGQKAAQTHLEWGVDKVLVTLEANSIQARQQMVVELTKALYPEIRQPSPSPLLKPPSI